MRKTASQIADEVLWKCAQEMQPPGPGHPQWKSLGAKGQQQAMTLYKQMTSGPRMVGRGTGAPKPPATGGGTPAGAFKAVAKSPATKSQKTPFSHDYR